MKKIIVVRVSMDDEKSRSKALKISVCISGVESATLKGNMVEVIGEGIDPVKLTRQLRKSMSHAELVSVGEVKPPDASANLAKAEAPESQVPMVLMYQPPYDGYSYSYPPEMRDQGCVIM